MNNLTNAGILQNPYQGKKKKVLFVCSGGILRSATASHIYANKHNTRCAGTHKNALIPLSEQLVAWADEVVFVHKDNYDLIDSGIKYLYKEKIKVLDIPDKYPYMDKDLIKLIEEQYESVLE